MADTWYITQGDLYPPLPFQLQGADGAGADLSGSTVKITIKTAHGKVLVDHANCDILNVATGSGEYAWAPGDTDVAGKVLADGRIEPHRIKFEQIRQDTKEISYPSYLYNYLVVTPKL